MLNTCRRDPPSICEMTAVQFPSRRSLAELWKGTALPCPQSGHSLWTGGSPSKFLGVRWLSDQFSSVLLAGVSGHLRFSPTRWKQSESSYLVRGKETVPWALEEGLGCLTGSHGGKHHRTQLNGSQQKSGCFWLVTSSLIGEKLASDF